MYFLSLNNWQILLYNSVWLFILLLLMIIVTQIDPVYAIFSFIFLSILVFSFLLFLGVEFISLLLVIIYTGVVAVLFLFTVIIYNLRSLSLYTDYLYYNPFWIFIIIKIFSVYILCRNSFKFIINDRLTFISKDAGLDVIYFIDLFNSHYIIFIFLGVLLFIAIIGSVIITQPFYKYHF
jgi:NADH-quinone oxidoreductase subunit J